PWSIEDRRPPTAPAGLWAGRLRSRSGSQQGESQFATSGELRQGASLFPQKWRLTTFAKRATPQAAADAASSLTRDGDSREIGGGVDRNSGRLALGIAVHELGRVGPDKDGEAHQFLHHIDDARIVGR